MEMCNKDEQKGDNVNGDNNKVEEEEKQEDNVNKEEEDSKEVEEDNDNDREMEMCNVQWECAMSNGNLQCAMEI